MNRSYAIVTFVCPSVHAISREPLDRFGPNLVYRFYGSKERTLLIFSFLGQPLPPFPRGSSTFFKWHPIACDTFLESPRRAHQFPLIDRFVRSSLWRKIAKNVIKRQISASNIIDSNHRFSWLLSTNIITVIPKQGQLLPPWGQRSSTF